MFSFLSKLFIREKKEQYTGLEPFQFEHDDLKIATSDQQLYELYIKDDRNEGKKPKKAQYIKARRDFYKTFPSPETVVQSFAININIDFIQLILKCLKEAPFSWANRFFAAEGHNTVFNYIQSILDKHKNTFITFRDPDFIIISHLLQIIILFDQSTEYSEKVFNDNTQWKPTKIFGLILKIFDPSNFDFDIECLKLLQSMIVSIPILGKKAITVQSIEEREKEGGISDFFNLLRILFHKKGVIDMIPLHQFIIAIATSDTNDKALPLYVGHRLIYADYPRLITMKLYELNEKLNLSSTEKDTRDTLGYISEFIQKSHSDYMSLIGTPFCDPRKPERLVEGLLEHEEMNAIRVRKKYLTDMFMREEEITTKTAPFLVVDEFSGSMAASMASEYFTMPGLYEQILGESTSNYEMLHRLFLELACIIGSRKSKNEADFYDIKTVEKDVRKMGKVIRKARKLAQRRDKLKALREAKLEAEKSTENENENDNKEQAKKDDDDDDDEEEEYEEEKQDKANEADFDESEETAYDDYDENDEFIKSEDVSVDDDLSNASVSIDVSDDEQPSKRSKATMEYILTLMRITRFFMMCSPDMSEHIVELFHRSALLVNSSQKKDIDPDVLSHFMSKKASQDSSFSKLSFLFDVEPGLQLSREWKKRSNFFAGPDFFASFVLKFVILITKCINVFHTKESPLDAQSCQTLTIMLNNATDELRTNFDPYYECISKSPLFDSFAKECLNKTYDANKESYEQVINDLTEIHKAQNPETQNENEAEAKVEEEEEEKEYEEEEVKQQTEVNTNVEQPFEPENPNGLNLKDFSQVQPEEGEAEGEAGGEAGGEAEGEAEGEAGGEAGGGEALAPPPPPPPPPPPVQSKPNVKLDVDMKQLFWDIIPYNACKNTIWEDIDDDDIDIDTDLLIERFRAAGTPNKILEADEEQEARVQKRELITLLDAKRKKNMDIVMRKFKMTPDEILGRLRKIDLTLAKYIDSLKSVIPTEEEVSFYRNYTGDVDLLSNTDKFVRLVGLFPLSVFRGSIEIIELTTEGKIGLDKIIQNLLTFKNAIDQINISSSLETILLVALRMGNIVNGGTKRGGAFGFKIEMITKLVDARTANEGESLLTFLVDHLMTNNPEAMNIEDELCSIPFAACYDLDQVKTSLEPYSLKIDSINKVIVSKEKIVQDNISKEFKKEAERINKTIGSDIKKAFSVLTDIKNSYDQLLVKYGEKDTTTPKEFFNYFVSFMSSFKKVKDELEKKKKEELKRRLAGNGQGKASLDVNDLRKGIYEMMMKRRHDDIPPPQ